MSCFSLVTYSKLRPDKARKILTNAIFGAGIQEWCIQFNHSMG